MIIQSETQMSVLNKLEHIVAEHEAVAKSYLKEALQNAVSENRSELLYSEKNEYELLNDRAEVLADTFNKIKNQLSE
jgi:hypothetical protein